jgi:hypothetical protein
MVRVENRLLIAIHQFAFRLVDLAVNAIGGDEPMGLDTHRADDEPVDDHQVRQGTVTI